MTKAKTKTTKDKSPALYACTNEHCDLGMRGVTGYFTGGMVAEVARLRTGKPFEDLVEGEDYGEGICGNCGEKGTPAGTHDAPEYLEKE